MNLAKGVPRVTLLPASLQCERVPFQPPDLVDLVAGLAVRRAELLLSEAARIAADSERQCRDPA
jgi:hypothetical protein